MMGAIAAPATASTGASTSAASMATIAKMSGRHVTVGGTP
ncbi:unnamed protein product [Ectocarpus sp. 8 AP-2014]